MFTNGHLDLSRDALTRMRPVAVRTAAEAIQAVKVHAANHLRDDRLETTAVMAAFANLFAGLARAIDVDPTEAFEALVEAGDQGAFASDDGGAGDVLDAVETLDDVMG